MKFSDRRHMQGYKTKYPSISMYVHIVYVRIVYGSVVQNSQ